MAKKIAASIALLAVVILSSYFFYRHISISWLDAPSASPAVSVSQSNIPVPPSLPSINKPGQGHTWVCPMHPEIMQDHPGTCPICGMDLVESKDHVGHDHGIHVDTASIQKLGVRLVSVKKSPVSQEIRSYGNVTADGGTVYNDHSKFDGWIRKMHIHSVGQKIVQGQVIYEIYSPELIMQQKEYLRFLERRKQILQTVGDVRLQENEYVMNLLMELSKERTKFIYEDVSLESLQHLEDSKEAVDVVKIVAEESGIVTQISAREGSYVTPSATLFTMANVSRVWVDIALYPDQAARVKIGDKVTIKNSDGQAIESKLDFLNPVAENNKVSARVAIDNSKLHLRPGSFADVIIHAQPHDALVLPRSAVMHTGAGDMVMLCRGEGHFLPIHIETGIESGDEIEITDGLLEDAEVAANGQFLLDAAASLNSAAQRMQETHTHQ